MSVGTWGYGTGATSAAAHPFSLCIQGIDVISAVPMESITVSGSVVGNATLSFSIYDTRTGPMTAFAYGDEEPQGWADVVFTDHTEGEVLFGGLVLSVRMRPAGPGSRRYIEVQCVDYGILLDRVPVEIDLDDVAWASWIFRPAYPPGITACEGTAYSFWTTPHGRIGNWPRYAGYNVWGGTGSYRGSIRGFLEGASIEGHDSLPVFIYIDPLRRLNVWSTWALTEDQKFAPLDVVVGTVGAGETATTEIELTKDYTGAETVAFLSDPITPANDGKVVGDLTATNGYAIGSDTVTYRPDYVALSLGTPYNVSFDSPRTAVAFYYLRQEKGGGSAEIRGSFTHVGTVNWEIGDIFTLTGTSVGISDEQAFVYSVSTKFLGGLLRESTVSWTLVPTPTGKNRRAANKPLISHWIRTRFARAGVTT